MYPAEWASFDRIGEEAPPRPQALRAPGCCTRSGELCSTCQRHSDEEERASREASAAAQTAAASKVERAAKKRKVVKEGSSKVRSALLLTESLFK